jgi:hypothetical protein
MDFWRDSKARRYWILRFSPFFIFSNFHELTDVITQLYKERSTSESNLALFIRCQYLHAALIVANLEYEQTGPHVRHFLLCEGLKVLGKYINRWDIFYYKIIRNLCCMFYSVMLSVFRRSSINGSWIWTISGMITDWLEVNYSDRNLSQCHSVRHEFHTELGPNLVICGENPPT